MIVCPNVFGVLHTIVVPLMAYTSILSHFTVKIVKASINSNNVDNSDNKLVINIK